MRYLLSLFLMVPALAQEPRLSPNNRPRFRQRAAPRRLPAAVAGSAASPVPSGNEWFTGSIDLGYLFLTSVDKGLN